MAFRIGPHEFLLMTGLIPQIAQTVEIIETPGEDNYILRKLGLRASPFEVQTMGAYATEVAARNAHSVFTNMIGEDPVGIEKDDINYYNQPTDRYVVHVLAVSSPVIRQFACISGTSNRWMMETSWTLLLEIV